MSGWLAVLVAVAVSWAGPNEAAKEAVRSEAGWTDIGTVDKDDIQDIRLRHRPLEGVDCLEASVTSALPQPVMQAVVLDIAGNKAWSSASLAASTVLSRSGSRTDYLQVLSMPPPFSARYWFARGTVQQSGGAWTFAWERLDGAATYPEQHAALLSQYSSAVEVTINVGSWSFLPAEGGQTLVRFRSCTNAGGSVPAWAGEKAARVMLPNNVVDLLREVRRRG